MKFSAFAKFGHLRFSGRPTHGEQIYRAIINSLGGQYATEIGTRAEAWAFATAMAIARARYTKERGSNQTDPLTTVELLPVREKEYGIIPGPVDTIQDRQRELARKMKLPEGARETAVIAALEAVLGADFLDYRTPTVGEIVNYPVNPATAPSNWVRVGTKSKVIRLVGSISTLGSPVYVTFESANPEEVVTLSIGDALVVSANNIGLAERVIVSNLGNDTFEATYTKAHDPGDICTTGYFPYWTSTQCHHLVVVTPAAKLDAEKCRLVNVVMSEIMKGVVGWDIVPSTGGVSTDAFTVQDATKGRVGYAGISAVAFP